MLRYILLIAGFSLALISVIQGQAISGKVYGFENSKQIPLVGASVYFSGSTEGTTTDNKGEFTIENYGNYALLVVSYVGFLNDTLRTAAIDGKIEVVLKNQQDLGEFEVTSRKRSTSISKLEPMKVEHISQKELRKAACCNLSESFETNPTVDVSYGDAVTGTRQITLLGLSGRYAQITRELIPSVRGLNTIQGLHFIPGTWIESIQVAKGPGSVVHGFESMTGQINVELFKPETADALYFNAYTNNGLRQEINVVSGFSVNENVHSAVMLHLNGWLGEFDMNNDNFLDMPIGTQANFMNRWQLYSKNGWETQLGVHAIFDDRRAGEIVVPENQFRNLYDINMKEQMVDFFAKSGYNFERPSTSLGFQLNGRLHENNSNFGPRAFNAEHNSIFFNSIFQSYIGSTTHQYTTGITVQHDQITEQLDSLNFGRTENVVGVYGEYSYNPSERFTLILGGRLDYHSIFGLFATPRLHTKYNVTENTVLRASAGRGQRTANILIDQYNFFASSRKINLIETHPGRNYGLNPEISYNYGVNLTHDFKLNYKEGYISIDAYRTDFISRVVADVDHSPQEVLIYNLNNLSYANALQVEVAYEPITRFDVKLAYRFFEARSEFTQGWLMHALLPKHRAFANFSYETKNEKWLLDLTAVYTGEQRLPITTSNPAEFQFISNSPAYVMMNAQIAYQYSKKTEWYLGVENLNNFQIDQAINSPENPFSPFFDTSMAWGPIFGRMIYAGVRYRIARK
ncbi:MAG: TonB-dependent receptor [Luteibaculaceae bacterium]